MQLSRLFNFLLLVSPLALCRAVTSSDEVYSTYSTECKNPLVRREWRLLPDHEKKEYIDAVKCLQALPALTSDNAPGAVTRFDDFQGIHIRQSDFIHNVGFFQHWHRYMIWAFEKALREECGYRGAQPYWDWTLDSASDSAFINSPLWSPTTGFGGNGPYIANVSNPFFKVPGRTGGGCVRDGPFSNYTTHMGPFNSTAKKPQCIRRDFSPIISTLRLTEEVVRPSHCENTFGGYNLRVQRGVRRDGLHLDELGPHGAGHLSVGGEGGHMSDVYASPGDPVFYLHHTGIDHELWKWQNADREARLKDATGPIIPFGFPLGNITGGGNIDLDFMIGLSELAPMVPLRRVMDTEGDLLCYTYAKEKAVYDPATGEWVAEEIDEYDDLEEVCGDSGN